jgi:hypothetical protein
LGKRSFFFWKAVDALKHFAILKPIHAVLAELCSRLVSQYSAHTVLAGLEFEKMSLVVESNLALVESGNQLIGDAGEAEFGQTVILALARHEIKGAIRIRPQLKIASLI